MLGFMRAICARFANAGVLRKKKPPNPIKGRAVWIRHRVNVTVQRSVRLLA
jgi:hypothetical protein